MGLTRCRPNTIIVPTLSGAGCPDRYRVLHHRSRLQSRWSTYSWWLTGTTTLGIGATAAGLAYLVGYLLREFVAG